MRCEKKLPRVLKYYQAKNVTDSQSDPHRFDGILFCYEMKTLDYNENFFNKYLSEDLS